MQISSRFTIAVHIFTCIAIAEKKYKVTSKFLAGSINVNPVIIRNIVLMLKAHGLIDSRQGTSGIKIAKCPSDITLLDIFNAVESLDNGQLFSFMKTRLRIVRSAVTFIVCWMAVWSRFRVPLKKSCKVLR